MMTPRQAAFRADYRTRISPWYSGLGHVAVIAALGLATIWYCARNIHAFLNGDKLKTKHFVELGEAVSLGTEHAAVLSAGKVIGGPLARQARFAMYTARLPTWHHRLRVGASWFFEGTAPQPLQPLGF